MTDIADSASCPFTSGRNHEISALLRSRAVVNPAEVNVGTHSGESELCEVNLPFKRGVLTLVGGAEHRARLSF